MRNGLPALGGGESSGQIRMSTHLYSKRKVCNLIFLGYKLIIRGVDNMAQTSINIRMDEELKKQFDAFCSEIGMNMTTAFCVFAKKAVRERRIPFEISADPFYSEENMTRLRESIRKVEAGEKSLTEHELIEV